MQVRDFKKVGNRCSKEFAVNEGEMDKNPCKQSLSKSSYFYWHFNHYPSQGILTKYIGDSVKSASKL